MDVQRPVLGGVKLQEERESALSYLGKIKALKVRSRKGGKKGLQQGKTTLGKGSRETQGKGAIRKLKKKK